MFEVPDAKTGDATMFPFKINGKAYAVPLMRYLPGSTVELLAEAEEEGGLKAMAARYAVFGEKGTPAGDAVRTLDDEQIDALTDAYVEASKISVGESSASTDS